MNITLIQVEAFTVLARTLHFSKAADQLGIAQPTLSKEIRALERTLRIRLLHRSPGGSTLTKEGAALLPLADAVLESAKGMEAHAARLQRGVSQKVVIAASPSIVNRMLPQILREVGAAGLGAEVSVLETETGEVVAAIDQGEADIGLGHHMDEPVRAQKRRLGMEDLQLVMAEDLAPVVVDASDLSGLATVPLLMWPRERSPGYHDMLVDVCRERGLDPLLLTGTSRISGAWSYFLHDSRAFALATRDFAASLVGDGLVAVDLEPPASVPLEVVYMDDPTGAVLAVLRLIAAQRGVVLRG